MRLVAHQTRYDLLAFSRNREALFFTVLLPLIFLVIFALVFGDGTVAIRDGEEVKQTTYYVPSLMALAITSAALQSLVFAVVTQRERGILKRRRATPVPAAVLVAGRSITAIVISFLDVIALAIVGALLYGVDIPFAELPAIIVTVAIGAGSLCCVGYAFSTFLRTEESATPVIQAVVLPLYFISGIFVPDDTVPDWLSQVADVFPIRPLGQSLLGAYTGGDLSVRELGVLLAWGIVALAVAAKRFRWTPQGTR